jgi:hypothetical protein
MEFMCKWGWIIQDQQCLWVGEFDYWQNHATFAKVAQIYIHSFPKVGTLYCKTLNLTTYLCKLPTSTWVAIGKKLGDKREQLQVCIQEQRCPLVLKGLRCHIVTDCVGFAFLSTCVSKEEFGWKTLLPCGGIMPIETTKMDAALGLF